MIGLVIQSTEHLCAGPFQAAPKRAEALPKESWASSAFDFQEYHWALTHVCLTKTRWVTYWRQTSGRRPGWGAPWLDVG
jgi:hypothetical protein